MAKGKMAVELEKPRYQPIGWQELARRFEAGLDLWTGKPRSYQDNLSLWRERILEENPLEEDIS